MTLIQNDRRARDDNEPAGVTRGDIRTLAEAVRQQRVNAAHLQPAMRATSAGALTTGPKLLHKVVTPITVVNTAAQTSVYSFSVPGGTLGTSNKLRLVLQGSVFNNSASAGSPRARVKYGATTIYDNPTPNALANAAAHSYTVTCELVAANATGAQRAHGLTVLGGTGGTTGVSTGNSTFQSAVHESVAEDSTLAKTLEVTIQLPAADPLLSCTIDSVFLELLRS